MFSPIHLNETPKQELRIPYDNRPFEAILQPGETIELYGDIEIRNELGLPLAARVYFDLHRGFILTITDAFSEQIEQRVPMHSSYSLQMVEGEWKLVENSLPS